MIQGSLWIQSKVQRAHNPDECIYRQKPDFYILLNNQLLKECNWCPFHTNCEICGGLNEILNGECYDCNKCGCWGE